jgi:hypothetical protein
MDKKDKIEKMRIAEETLMKSVRIFGVEGLNPNELGVLYVLCNHVANSGDKQMILTFKMLKKLLHLDGVKNRELHEQIIEVAHKIRGISLFGRSEVGALSFNLFGTIDTQDGLMITEPTEAFRRMMKDLNVELYDDAMDDEWDEEWNNGWNE